MVGLFKDYIDCFLGLKIEASGWPKDVKTDKEKEDFITNFFEREQVRIDPEKMIRNPGMRMLAKLCLNSFCKKPCKKSALLAPKFPFIVLGGRLGMKVRKLKDY